MSKLIDAINQDFLIAYKQHSERRVATLRLLKSALSNAQIALGHELSDTNVTDVIRKEAKKRQEVIELYNQSGKTEAAQNEQAEYELLAAYLPQQLNPQEIGPYVDAAIKQIGAQDMTDFGKVMGEVVPQLKGKADASLIAKLVKERLANEL